jgi:hypothetical protein
VPENNRNGLEKDPCKSVEQEENHEKAHAGRGPEAKWEIPDKMKTIHYSILLALLLTWLTTGCESIKPGVAVKYPTVDMSKFKTFYVARDDDSDAQNERHVRTLHAVQDALADHGMAATSGMQSAIPANTDCKVIIHDKWFWDLSWYLLYLDIKFYDARSGQLLASAHDVRSAPGDRRDPDYMANEALESILHPTSGFINH